VSQQHQLLSELKESIRTQWPCASIMDENKM